MKSIGVFTSGGDAPGMNTCVRAVVRTCLFYKLKVFGIRHGFNGLIEENLDPLTSYDVSNIMQRGGTILKSARSAGFMTPEGRQKAYDTLKKHGIDALIAIGGDGTFTGAKIFHEEFNIPVMGVPGTIDNDLWGTDFTIGFDTAVNTALRAIDHIRDTANSHDRVFFIEVMGRNSGYIALHCGIGGGAEMVLVPEDNISKEEVVKTLQKGRDKNKTSAIIVVAEGNKEGDAQTMANYVKERLPHLDIRVSILGHMQRGGSPSSRDRIIASRLGMAAVSGLMKGKCCDMVGIINHKLVFHSLHDSITKTKPLRDDLIQMVEILNS